MKIKGGILGRQKGKGKGEKKRGIKKRSRWGEYDQSTFYAYMEMS
jgi:hypothetical protein